MARPMSELPPVTTAHLLAEDALTASNDSIQTGMAQELWRSCTDAMQHGEIICRTQLIAAACAVSEIVGDAAGVLWGDEMYTWVKWLCQILRP